MSTATINPKHIAELKPCLRCGFRYRPKHGGKVLCRDCRAVLSKEEKQAWLR